MATLALDGTDLYYTCEGDGVAVLLIHGLGLDTRMWDDQVPALREVARVIRYDARGFGRSSRRDPDVTYTHAGDAWALLDHLGIHDVVLVGLSMGGRIALETLLAAPQRVRALVVMDAVLGGVPWDSDAKRGMAAVAEAMHNGGVAAANSAWLEHPFFVPASRDPVLAARLKMIVEDSPGLHWATPDPHGPAPVLMDALEQIEVPTTVIVGELDVDCFLAMAEILATRIPGARKVVVPDAGHMVNMEAPAVVNAVVRDVLDNVA
jgi:3-oxoadipate enol-lactonase